MIRFSGVIVALAAIAIFAGMSGNSEAQQEQDTDSPSQNDGFSRYVDEKGEISLPSDYKTKWTHLGDWAVAKTKGEDPHELHEVYTQPGVVEAFQKTGKFPDGAVLVKEVRKTEAGKLTTGHVSWAGEIKIWFVMVKGNENRFPDSNIWGNGWGWALFEAKDPLKNTNTNWRTSCLGCHVPAQKTDWVYRQGYPELKKKDK